MMESFCSIIILLVCIQRAGWNHSVTSTIISHAGSDARASWEDLAIILVLVPRYVASLAQNSNTCSHTHKHSLDDVHRKSTAI